MAQLLDTFDGAAEVPGVPRLVPIATYGYFRRSAPAPKPAPDAA
jgi:hypothetical protein